jgi:hypothetical protein
MIKSPPLPVVAVECRVLAVIGLNGEMSVDEMLLCPALGDLDAPAVSRAVRALLAEGRLDVRIVAARYHWGEKYLRREVPVYSLARGGTT